MIGRSCLLVSLILFFRVGNGCDLIMDFLISCWDAFGLILVCWLMRFLWDVAIGIALLLIWCELIDIDWWNSFVCFGILKFILFIRPRTIALLLQANEMFNNVMNEKRKRFEILSSFDCDWVQHHRFRPWKTAEATKKPT